MEIGKGRLTLDKLQVHQPTGCIVDEHEQRTLRTAILKPIDRRRLFLRQGLELDVARASQVEARRSQYSCRGYRCRAASRGRGLWRV
jgi:hypothetical protein